MKAPIPISVDKDGIRIDGIIPSTAIRKMYVDHSAGGPDGSSLVNVSFFASLDAEAEELEVEDYDPGQTADEPVADLEPDEAVEDDEDSDEE